MRALPLLLAVASLVPALGLSMGAAHEGPVAAVFPPWWSAAQSMTAAGRAGAIVRLGGVSFVVVIMPEGESARRELTRAGALLILDPRAFGGCAPLQTT